MKTPRCAHCWQWHVQGSPCAGVPASLMGDDLVSLPMSTRAFNTLQRVGVTTIAQAASLSVADYMLVKNCGKKTAMEIQRVLSTHVDFCRAFQEHVEKWGGDSKNKYEQSLKHLLHLHAMVIKEHSPPEDLDRKAK
jgi:DNA-directed RNA polymerase alpha subunit